MFTHTHTHAELWESTHTFHRRFFMFFRQYAGGLHERTPETAVARSLGGADAHQVPEREARVLRFGVWE